MNEFHVHVLRLTCKLEQDAKNPPPSATQLNKFYGGKFECLNTSFYGGKQKHCEHMFMFTQLHDCLPTLPYLPCSVVAKARIMEMSRLELYFEWHKPSNSIFKAVTYSGENIAVEYIVRFCPCQI